MVQGYSLGNSGVLLKAMRGNEFTQKKYRQRRGPRMKPRALVLLGRSDEQELVQDTTKEPPAREERTRTSRKLSEEGVSRKESGTEQRTPTFNLLCLPLFCVLFDHNLPSIIFFFFLCSMVGLLLFYSICPRKPLRCLRQGVLS